MSDEVNKFLLAMAAEAKTEGERLALILEATIRPALRAFLVQHVVIHGGPQPGALPDIYMKALASVSAEMIDNTVFAVMGSTPERRKLAAFAKRRFATHLDAYLRGKAQTFGQIRRADA